MTYFHEFDPSIRRTNNIRGIVRDTLTELGAFAIGRGVATVVVRSGGDGRDFSPTFAEAVNQGVAKAGFDAFNVDPRRSPTPRSATSCLNRGPVNDAAGAVLEKLLAVLAGTGIVINDRVDSKIPALPIRLRAIPPTLRI